MPDAMLMILPFPWARMCGITTWQHRKTPRTLTAITRSHSSTGMSWIGEGEGREQGRVVDEHVHPSERVERRLEHHANCGLVGDVRSNRDGASLAASTRLGRGPRARLVDVCHDDPGTLFGKPAHVNPPDPLRPAGDDDHPVLQSHSRLREGSGSGANHTQEVVKPAPRALTPDPSVHCKLHLGRRDDCYSGRSEESHPPHHEILRFAQADIKAWHEVLAM